MRPSTIVVLSAAALVSLLAFAAGAALARKATAPEAADKGLGTAVMGALVSAAGTLQHGAGAVSASKIANPGGYAVTFARSVRDCVPVASVMFDSTNGYASTSHASADERVIRVITQQPNGNNTDRPFALIVFCAG